MQYKRQIVLSITSIPHGLMLKQGSEGSIFSPLLFIVAIKDLSDDLASNFKLFANNASILYIVQSIDDSGPRRRRT